MKFSRITKTSSNLRCRFSNWIKIKFNLSNKSKN